MDKHITRSVDETRELAGEFVAQLCPGDIICLEGELGSGKTAFAQGMLAALGAEGPYTSPTFSIIKKYPLEKKTGRGIDSVHHIDAYRIASKDLLELGWRDIINDIGTVVIIEWPECVAEIIPPNAKHVTFAWESDRERAVTLPDTPQTCTAPTSADPEQSPFL